MNKLLTLIAALFLGAIVTNAQTVTTYSGTAGTYGNNGGGTATISTSKFYDPFFMCFDPNGKMYISDPMNHCIKIVDGSNVYTRAGSILASGSLGMSGLVDAASTNSRFNEPAGMVCDASGNLFVCDQMNHAIRKITAYVNVGNAQTISTFAGAYPTATSGNTNGTGTAARFDLPAGICIDNNGNFYVTEEGNNQIRKITPAGVVSTVTGSASTAAGGFLDGTLAQAKFKYPRGIKFVSAENALYVADYGNKRIRKIDLTAGTVSTFAGTGSSGSTDGAPASTAFRGPNDLIFDQFGNMFVSDAFNANTIRKWTKVTNTFSTVCGTYQTIGTTDGQGAAARFSQPAGLVMNAAGTGLYVCDKGNHTIRLVDLTPKADFYAQQTTLTTGASTVIKDTSLNSPTVWTWTISPGTNNVDYKFVGGTNSNSQNPNVQFLTANTYSVTLLVSNSYGSLSPGNTKTRTSYITVSNATGAPVADFVANATIGNTTTVFNFSNTTTNCSSGCTYSWSFSPNTISYVSSTQNDANPSVRFNQLGQYTATLTVSKTGFPNAVATKTNYITIVPVGINEIELNTLVNSIYPNPNRGSFTIDFSTTLKTNTKISLMDMTGRILLNDVISGVSSYKVEAGAVKPGLYLLNIEIDGRVIGKRVVIE